MAALAVFLAGAALLVAALRWWRPGFPPSAALAYLALTLAFFARPLVTGNLQAATDLAYDSLPFAESAAAPGTEPRNVFRTDTLLEQVPFHVEVRARLLAGEMPLWSHEMGTGQPLLGNGQSAPFAPLHLLALPLATLRGLTVAGAWQIFLGLLLTHALLLRLGAGPWGAALGAVGAGLSTYAVVWIYDTPGMAAAWVPGLLLGILLVRDGAPRGWAGLVACALGLALSGHPETMAHAGIAALLLAGLLVLRPAPAGLRRFLLRLVAAAALAAALAAPALLPLVEVLPHSVRGTALARSPENFQPPPFEADFLLPLFSPLAMGSPPDGTYGLRWSFNEICSDYAGLLVLALALAGALALRGRRLLLLALGAAALGAALRLPPFFDLMLHLPVIGPGAHGRMREFWVLAVALGAGLTLERVAAARMPRRIAAAFVLAAGIGLLLVPPGAGIGQGGPGALPRVAAAGAWPVAWWLAALAGTAAAFLALLLPRLRPAFPPVVVAAVTCELLLLGCRYHPAVPARLDLSPPPTVAWLAERSAAASAAGTPFRVSFEDFDLPPNLGSLFGLWDPRGYDPARPEDAARMTGWWLGHQRRFYQIIRDSLPVPDQASHDFLGVRFLATSHQRDLPLPWRLAFEGAGGRVWENPRALGLFFMPQEIEEVSTFDEERQQAMHNEDFAATAWTVSGAPAARRAQEGRVEAIHPRANGFDLEVASPTGGTVISSVSYAPDWQVAGDGLPAAPAHEVNGGFLGVDVPPGTHRLRLRYRPRGWSRGLGLCLAGVVAALLRGLVRRRRSQTGAAPDEPAGPPPPADLAARPEPETPGTRSPLPP